MNPSDWINLGSAVVDVGSNIVSGVQNKKQFEHQKAVDEFNMDMANKNYQLAVDQMNWQQEAQQTAWSREDNAIRRRVADLEAAGMSKWQAAGQAAQAGGVTASNVTSAANLINSGARYNQNNFKNPVDSFLVGSERQAGISLTQKQQELTQANIDNVNQDTINKSSGNDKIKAEIDQINNDVQKTIEQLELQKKEFEEQKKLWESERNKNTALAKQAKDNALKAKTEAAHNVQKLKTYKTYYKMAIEEHEEKIKNSKNERHNRTANTVRQSVRDLSNILDTWIGRFTGAKSNPNGFQFYD